MTGAQALTRNIEREFATVRNLWDELIPLPVSDGQIRFWLGSHNLASITYSILETRRKFIRLGGEMTPEWAVKFASAVMNGDKKNQ